MNAIVNALENAVSQVFSAVSDVVPAPDPSTGPSPLEVDLSGITCGIFLGPYACTDVVVESYEGREAMNDVYAFDVFVRVVACDDPQVEDSLLGAHARLFWQSAAGYRVVDGVLASVQAVGRHRLGGAVYSVRIVPRLEGLKHRRTSRIFQDMTVQDIVDEVVGAHGVVTEWNLLREYPKRGYCVQYRETDYEFVTRLLAEEGIAFGFRQPDVADPDVATETLVLLDDPFFYAPIDGTTRLRIEPQDNVSGADVPTIQTLMFRRNVGVGSVSINQYDFRRPLYRNLSSAGIDQVEAAGDDAARHQTYEHHLDYDIVETASTDTASALLGQHRARLALAEAYSQCRDVAPGRTFTLDGHELSNLNQTYVVAEVKHFGYSDTIDRGENPLYRNELRCAPSSTLLRPAPAKRAIQQVAETAIVVGPPGQEIHTDYLGRVKIQFPWDLDGKRDGRSSCFVRVVQAWAGAGWGHQFVPRVGMEVLVTFVGGDTDCPVVTGCLNSPINTPARLLPGSAAVSGIRTSTSPGGAGYNELAFDDSAGNERMSLRAQRDLVTRVLKDRATHVEGNDVVNVRTNRTVSVDRDASTTVGGNERRHVVGDGLAITDGNQVHVVNGNADLRTEKDHTVRINGNERRAIAHDAEETIAGTRVSRVKEADVTLIGDKRKPGSALHHVEGSSRFSSSRETEIRSDKVIVLRCGKSSIRITPDAIEIIAPAVRVKGAGASLAIAGGEARLSAKKAIRAHSEATLLTSPNASLALGADAKLEGTTVEISCNPAPGEAQRENEPPPTVVVLNDDAGQPMAFERYVVTTDEGEESGILDAHGRDEITATSVKQVVFPDLDKVEEA